MRYHFKISKETNGYWGTCIELQGCSSQGKTKKELIENLYEALNLYFNEPSDSKLIFPEPKKRVSQKNIIEIAVEPTISFAYLLRKERLRNNLTQKQVANKLGFKNIYSYQRLESAKTANPALKTIQKIINIFPNLKFDDVLAC